MSKITICNRALGLLGERAITSLNDTDNERSVECKLHYEPSVRYLLARGRFAFSLDRATLVPDPQAPAFGFSTKHRLPTDPKYLTLFEINGYDECPFEYEIEGQFFLSNKDTIQIRYVKRVEEAQFTAEFEEALVSLLASRMALKLTGSSSTKQAHEVEAERLYLEAVTIDWSSRPPRKIYRQPGRAAFL